MLQVDFIEHVAQVVDRSLQLTEEDLIDRALGFEILNDYLQEHGGLFGAIENALAVNWLTADAGAR